jgi:hypothetical protein
MEASLNAGSYTVLEIILPEDTSPEENPADNPAESDSGENSGEDGDSGCFISDLNTSRHTPGR